MLSPGAVILLFLSPGISLIELMTYAGAPLASDLNSFALWMHSSRAKSPLFFAV